MSLENNLHEVKDKLAKDQNLLVSAFKLETFYKKYKNFLFLILAILVLFGIYQGVMLYQKHRTTEQAKALMNTLYSQTITEEERKSAEAELATIKPVLYDFYRFMQLQNLTPLQLKTEENIAILVELQSSKDSFIAALANYQYATLTEDRNMLENFSGDAAPLLRDRARLQAAYLYLQDNDTQKAREILESISTNGNNQAIAQSANLLQHYGLTNLATQESAKENTQAQ